MGRKNKEEEVTALLEKYRFNNSENQLQRLPLQRETELMNKILQGKYREIHVLPFRELLHNVGCSTRNQIKLYEYYTVSAIALGCRYAIKGGVSQEDACDLADILLGEVEKASTEEEYHDLFELSLICFAKAVHRGKCEKSSYMVEQCKTYISRHIFEKIRLEDVAAFVGMNPNYLCGIFQGETGITIHNYIQQKKVEVSCNLLKFSQSSVTDIAHYMGFASQSNYGVIFRKWKGMTPTEYRQKNYLDNYFTPGND